jgi:predicted transcriptional regulator
MTERTLHVTVESDSEFHERVRERLNAIEEGESPAQPHVLSLPDTAAVARVFSETTLTLLQAIAAERPESVRETARLVGRDVKDVSEQLNELSELGVVDFEPNGRAKRPVVWYDDIELTFPLRFDESSPDRRASV